MHDMPEFEETRLLYCAPVPYAVTPLPQNANRFLEVRRDRNINYNKKLQILNNACFGLRPESVIVHNRAFNDSGRAASRSMYRFVDRFSGLHLSGDGCERLMLSILDFFTERYPKHPKAS